MRSKKSCFNGTVIKKDLIHFLPVLLLWTATLLTAILISNISNQMRISERYGYLAKDIPNARTQELLWNLQGNYIPTLFAIAGCGFGILLFYYLHFTKSSHMIHAYPVRRETLFFSHYLAGLLMLLVPAIVTGLAVAVLAGTIEPHLLGPVFYWTLWAVIAGAFFYSLSVFLCLITGVIFLVPVLFLVANYLVDGIRFLVLGFVAAVNYGCGGAAGNIGITEIWAPIGHLGARIGFSVPTDEKGAFLWNERITYQGAGSLCFYLIVAVVLTALALFLYKKRRIEDVGKLIAVRPLRPVFQWGVTFCAALLLSLFFSDMLPLTPHTTFPVLLLFFLGFSVLIFYLLEVVMTRRWRSMNKKKWAELVVFALVFSALGGMCEADIFGVEKRVPEVSDLIAVDAYVGREIVSGEAVDLETVIALQRELIEEKDVLEDALSTTGGDYWVSLTYYRADGKKLMRSYEVPQTDSTASLPAIRMLSAIERDEHYYQRDQFCVNYEDMEFTGGGIDLYDDTFPDGNYESYNLEFGPEEAKAIYEAYMQDFAEGRVGLVFSEDTEQSLFDDLRLDFYIPGGVPITQDMLLWQLTGDDFDMYEDWYGDAYYGRTQPYGTTSTYPPINRSCVHTIEAMERYGFFEGGYHLVDIPESW